MRGEASVTSPARGWRAAFLGSFIVLSAFKVMIACTLSPFGDEAFYWWESRHPAWGYSDLPPFTAWLIGLGEALAGHGLIGMRWPFLVMGAALPWLAVAMARRCFGARIGWQAGLAIMALPLAGTLGVLALPDVPLTLGFMLAFYALWRALEDDAWRHWLGLGMALALCWATHYRAAMIVLAGLVFFVLVPRGRAQWRNRRFWVAMGVALLGLVPLLISNLRDAGAGIAFQLVQRNPWQFHADALVQPLEQSGACTPLLYGLLLWTLWRCWRRRGQGGPWDLAAVTSAVFIFAYFGFGLFADDTRFRAHWPLPGYLPLLVLVPALLAEWRSRVGRVWVVAAFSLAVFGELLALAYLALAASDGGAAVLAHYKAFPGNFVGWRQAAAQVRQLRARDPKRMLVADNFMLGAELAFALDRPNAVYVLDNPLNVKHGRAPQLATWQRNEAALRREHAGAPVWLAVDETALSEREEPDWLRSLCSRIDGLAPVARVMAFDGRTRLSFYAGRVPVTPLPAQPARREQCVAWQRGYQAYLKAVKKLDAR
ncbi:glycosyltransferase family 39 protein [Oleiagrimonas sp. C23AA]|uniref:glycosyltransferase family 39 protein n=1 Tax=Oleiagrimonas sp. C23AA TaxID=2719047 RepID=UPI00142338F6|nr:glycosyltransferase family 39 protein [Oleiagrimonas sp. C23AA]NII10311.1 glycosyltransferase family 39 protein [Oleiagrimonas sp. C23AA]